MTRSRALFLVALLWVGHVSRASAQAPEDPKLQAKQHYQAGERAYNVGDFEVAIREWKEAYRLHGSPDFLFNIGQAYRAARDYAQAMFFFNAYLRERPNAANAAEVTTLRDEMKTLLEQESASKDRPPKQPIPPEGITGDDGTTAPRDPAPPVTVVATPTQPSQPSTRPSSTMKRAGLITLGGGVLFSTVGIVLVRSASSSASDLEAAAERNEPWTEDLEAKDRSARRNSTVGTVLIGTGIAAVVAGGVLAYVGHRATTSERKVAIAPAVDGSQAGLVVWGRF